MADPATAATESRRVGASPRGSDLLHAYVAARYRVRTRTGWRSLQVGRRSPLPEQSQPGCVQAILTACNPGSQPLPFSTNARRMQALARRLEALELVWHPALNSAPSGAWREPAYWLPVAPLTELDQLAGEFDQNACLVVDIQHRVCLRIYARDWAPATDEPYLQWAPT